MTDKEWTHEYPCKECLCQPVCQNKTIRQVFIQCLMFAEWTYEHIYLKDRNFFMVNVAQDYDTKRNFEKKTFKGRPND